jgi:hypothetical protein
MTLDADTLNLLAERVADELENRGLVLPTDEATAKREVGLATPGQLAAEIGVSRRTVHRRICEWDLVRRDAEGYPKDQEGGATYISRTAWQKRGPVATQTVRRLAGLTD